MWQSLVHLWHWLGTQSPYSYKGWDMTWGGFVLMMTAAFAGLVGVIAGLIDERRSKNKQSPKC
ncbi:MAG: hypothetical protein JO316_15545 [Abitibacteriaceae bacterium]|nr:hypothetical protein [Abditibacteriaceae bacterium]